MGTITSEHLALQDEEHHSSRGARIKLYEELEGGRGREIFFRPHRYTPDYFAPLSIWAELTLNRTTHRCDLLDLSQSGLGLIWPSEHAPTMGETIAEIEVHFDEQLAGHDNPGSEPL